MQENKVNLNNKSKSMKIVLWLSFIFLIFSLALGAMLFYYNNLMSNLGIVENVNIVSDGSSALPVFKEGVVTDEVIDSVEINTGNVLDNLNKIENLKKDEEALKGAKLVTIENQVVGDYVIAKKQISTTSDAQIIVRYFIKKTGDIVDYDRVKKEKQILNIDKLTDIEDVKFSKNGDYIVMRKYDGLDIISKLLLIRTNTFYDLEKNITSFDFLENDNLVYGIKKGDGYSIKSLDTKTQKVRDIVILPMTQWGLEVSIEQNIRAFIKPSGDADGISVLIDQRSGKVQNEIKPIKGMSVKKTSDKKYLIVTEGGLGFNNLLFMNKNTQNIFSLNTNTFIEKCAKDIIKNGIVCAVPERLNRQSLYPDTWYKGIENTKDILVYNSLTSTSTKLVYSFPGQNVSVENISVSQIGVFFQDSKSKSLYTLE
jgi:hypothetical protein